MHVKINALVNVIDNEELIILPIDKNGDFVLALNFYEDIPGGRQARLVIVYDKYDEINFKETIIKGDKAIVEAYGVDEDMKKISEIIKIDRYLRSNRVPFYVNIEILKDADINARGVRGYINYINKYGEISIEQLKNVVKLIIE